jgi:hypothetical protein
MKKLIVVLEAVVAAFVLGLIGSAMTGWSQGTVIDGTTSNFAIKPVLVDNSGVLQTNATFSGTQSVSISGVVSISGINASSGAWPTTYSGTQAVTISSITANTTGTTSSVAVTSANGVVVDSSDSLRKTILGCNKDSVYNAALGLTSPVTAANAFAIIPPLNCIALSTNVLTNAIYGLGYSTGQATFAFTSGH